VRAGFVFGVPEGDEDEAEEEEEQERKREGKRATQPQK
jgi:hypothetical protein